MSQSIQATARARMGVPESAGLQLTSTNFSGALEANARQMCSWSAPRTLAQKNPASRIFGKVVDFLSGRNATRGGSRETEVNDPTAMPTGAPSGPMDVIPATPVGK